MNHFRSSVSGPETKNIVSTRSQIWQRCIQPNFEERLTNNCTNVWHVLFASALLLVVPESASKTDFIFIFVVLDGSNVWICHLQSVLYPLLFSMWEKQCPKVNWYMYINTENLFVAFATGVYYFNCFYYFRESWTVMTFPFIQQNHVQEIN